MFNATTSQVGRQLVVMIVWLMKRLNFIILLNNMKDNFDKLFNVVLVLTVFSVILSVIVVWKAVSIL
jgi:hypothetical protein